MLQSRTKFTDAERNKPSSSLITLPESGKEIEFHLAMPDWFKKYVRVCFEWAPTTGPLHNSKQCNQGSRPRKLCAKLGEFTLDYLDNTDMSFGGCFYRLLSPNLLRLESNFLHPLPFTKMVVRLGMGSINSMRASTQQNWLKELDDTDQPTNRQTNRWTNRHRVS